jgi:hypothetical protein
LAFGFDAACIALCRATFEQVTKDSLVRIGEYSDARLKREQPTAGALLAVAKRTGLIVRSATAAEHLVKKGDTVMHKFIYDGRVREQQARDSIAQLAEVLVELLGDGSQASRPAT